MPGAVATALYAAVGAGWISLGVTAITAISYAVAIGGMIGIGKMQQRRAQRKARDAYNAGLKDRTVMVATVDAARSRVYGAARNVDGVLFIGSHGANKEKLVLVVAVAGHEASAIQTVYFNDEPVTLDADGWVQTEPYAKTRHVAHRDTGSIAGGTGSVTLSADPVGSVHVVCTGGTGDGAFSVEMSASVDGRDVTYTGATALDGYTAVVTWTEVVIEPKARVWKFLGGSGQNIGADATLKLYEKFDGTGGQPLITTTDHRGEGIAAVAVEFDYDQDAFPSGLPQVSALVNGAYVGDPRMESGLTWTKNLALIARDWALYAYGGRALSSEVDEASFVAAANACDVSHDFAVGEDTQTLPMYEGGIVCKTDTNPWQQLEEIVEGMAGKPGWAGGKLRVKAGAYTAPVAEITEDWISDAEPVQVVPAPSRQDLVNVIRPTIADSSNNYIVAPTPEIRAEAYITADGAEYPLEAEYGAVTDQIHAQHVAGVQMRDARSGLTCVLPCNMRAYPVELFDVVTVTLPRFGWEAKTFEVVSWKWSLTGGILLGLKETAASIYDPDEGFNEADATPNTALPKPWQVPQITGVSVTSGTEALTDGSILTRTLVSFDAVTSAAVVESGRIEIAWTPAAEALPDGDWPSQTFAGNVTAGEIVGLVTGRHYLFRVRGISTMGVRGKWSDQVLHKVALPPGLPSVYSQEDEPAAPHVVGDLWHKPSSGAVKRWDGSAWQAWATDGADWGSVTGRPKAYRAAAHGYSSTSHPIAAGLYDGETGAVLFGLSRSYKLVRIRRSDRAITYSGSYDVIFDPAEAARLAADLNATGSDHIVVAYTYDEPQTNRMTNGLPEAMYRCGASRAVFGSPQFQYRSAYVLIGIGGCGEGAGFEAYQGEINNDPNAWVDVSFLVTAQGQLLVSGNRSVPRTLADYSYVGDLDATKGAVFGVNISGLAQTSDLAPNAATVPFFARVTSQTVISSPGETTILTGSGDTGGNPLSVDFGFDMTLAGGLADTQHVGTLRIYVNGSPYRTVQRKTGTATSGRYIESGTIYLASPGTGSITITVTAEPANEGSGSTSVVINDDSFGSLGTYINGLGLKR